MPMKADLWFPTVIWNDTLKHINNSEIKEFVYKVKESDKGREISNYGGWQSQLYDITSTRPIPIERFIQSLQKCVDDCTKMAGLPDLQICDYWWNINYKGDYNHPHTHRDSILSGVYYIDIPDENMGNIHFEREDDAEYFLPRVMPKRNHITAERATYKPINGGILIFPSWVYHSVDGNKSDKPRISMSFNTSIAMTPANDELARLNGFPPLTDQ